MSKRKRFRELINAPGMVYAPGAYDALSARIIEAQGFDVVVAGGYAAVGVLLGQPDTGQSNVRDYADHYGRICAAVNVPVYVDGDTGFGGVNNVRQMVRAFEDAGVAGLFIGDQVFPNRCGYMEGKQLVPAEEMLSKLKAALDARRDPDLYIVARTDALAVEGLDRTIERAQLYKDIGVDMAKVIGADRLDDFGRILSEVPGPQMANMSNANPKGMPTPAEFEAAGAAMMTFPSAALFAAVGEVTRAMASLKRDSNLDAARPGFCALQDYYELVGLERQNAAEQDYLAAARAVIEKRRR
ncbi:MAG: oxaloacetate decarboxylase [Beijerinckiaceae bacterium]|nr:oxaloacetate decarboxylase [Beijerinckiaceae bacterium]